MTTTNTPTLRVVLADDHLVFSGAIQEYLHRFPDILVVAIVERCTALDDVIREHHPDLLLLDLSMEPGSSPTAAIHRLRQIHPALKIVILSAHQETCWVLEMMEAKADGYVHKSERPSVLVEAIRRVAAGEVWYSPSLLNSLRSGAHAARTRARGAPGDR